MFIERITRSTLLSIALVAGAASALSAQDRLFEWRGNVDREVRVVMRGSDVRTLDASGRQRRGGARVSSALPSRAGQVRIQVLDGRGDVNVIQQPSRTNDYTTIVRISDRSGGRDRYRIAAYWQPIGRGGWDDGSRDGRDRDGRFDGRFDDRFGGSGRLRWAGAVDDEVEIRIQGRNVDTRALSGNGARDVRTDLDGRVLPRRDVQVNVRQRQGRGTVTVVQQPGQYNGYTAVIRVRDRQGGFGFYDFDITW